MAYRKYSQNPCLQTEAQHLIYAASNNLQKQGSMGHRLLETYFQIEGQILGNIFLYRHNYHFLQKYAANLNNDSEHVH